MDYNEFSRERQNIPNIESAVSELFERARAVSEHRFFLTILQLHAFVPDPSIEWPDGRPKRHLFLPVPGLGIEQFCEFVSALAATDLSETETESERNFLRRLQMLAYSQFWELLEIQTLLLQMSLIANDAQYDPNLRWEYFHKKMGSCNSIYEQVIRESRKVDLRLAEVLAQLYFSQIRNAFVHSQFHFIAGLVCFENADLKKNPNDIPSLKLEMWDSLFADTLKFVSSLFSDRKNAQESLIEKCPFTFRVPEIAPFSVLHTCGEFRFVDNSR